MLGMIESLESTVKGLVWKQPRTEWAGYTSDNTYTKNARKHKHEIVSEYLDQVAPESVWDLGANTGEYSRLASSRGIQTVSFDIDPACVERNYRAANEANDRNVLPLLADLTNPSPAAGWASSERQSFADRGPVDLVMALALVHHLAIVHNLPLSHIAEFFSQLCQSLIIEFVPKDDPQVVRLLRGRVDIFDHYTRQDFEAAFRERFRICRSATIVENGRILYLMERI
jgi:ribosomal protein L11 methylase PrmA